jgi:hypothetical protein
MSTLQPGTKGIFIQVPVDAYYRMVSLAADQKQDVEQFVCDFVVAAYENAQAFKRRKSSPTPHLQLQQEIRSPSEPA